MSILFCNLRVKDRKREVEISLYLSLYSSQTYVILKTLKYYRIYLQNRSVKLGRFRDRPSANNIFTMGKKFYY